MGPWARTFLAALAGGEPPPAVPVADLRIEPSLITARVDGRPVTLSAATIPAGIWAAEVTLTASSAPC